MISALGEVPIGQIVASLVECMGYRPSLRKFTDAGAGDQYPLGEAGASLGRAAAAAGPVAAVESLVDAAGAGGG